MNLDETSVRQAVADADISPVRHWLFWPVRIATMAFAGFLSLMALDALQDEAPFWPMLLGLTVHLVPGAALLVLLALSWRRPWVGAVMYPALGLCYIIAFWLQFPLLVYCLVAGPLFILGALFGTENWLEHRGPASDLPPPDHPVTSG